MSAPGEKPRSITSPIDPDLGAVRKFIEEMLQKGAVAGLVAAIVALLMKMRDLNTELMKKLASKSRKRPPNEAMRRLQMELPFLCAPAANDAKPEVSDGKKPKKRGAKKPKAHGRPMLPSHLPRVPNVLLVAAAKRTCPDCNVEVRRICLKTTAEKLDVEPSKFIVSQTQVETCGCPKCHQYIVTADKGDEIVDRGILGNELLVQAMVDHYQDAVPWERMERNARQERVPLAANTLASSVGRMIDLFDPIVRHVREACLSSSFTALDATRMPVLEPLHPLGITSGALWLIEGAHRYACFLYAPSAHSEHLRKFFEGRKLGSVMCDGSPTNNCVEKDAGGHRGGCNAHGRRGLVEALRGGDARAVQGLELYARIFHVDAESKRLGETLEQRFERRQRDSAPVVWELRAWVDVWRADVEPKSVLGKALGYLHRQWPRLTAFLRDPRMELTNNEVEGDLRTWVLDRKTWLFVGHETSARRAADALTILTTCKKMGINPRSYLRDTLAKILAGEKHLAALLPETYAASTVERASPVAA
ncbi:MAG: IS66 family transposase [Alphaproteobacteria bacterium]|nr:MAG: IS66 family transposase [Alphaproteobacteria bacterium]